MPGLSPDHPNTLYKYVVSGLPYRTIPALFRSFPSYVHNLHRKQYISLLYSSYAYRRSHPVLPPVQAPVSGRLTTSLLRPGLLYSSPPAPVFDNSPDPSGKNIQTSHTSADSGYPAQSPRQGSSPMRHFPRKAHPTYPSGYPDNEPPLRRAPAPARSDTKTTASARTDPRLSRRSGGTRPI